jgi:hypothetical protein
MYGLEALHATNIFLRNGNSAGIMRTDQIHAKKVSARSTNSRAFSRPVDGVGLEGLSQAESG